MGHTPPILDFPLWIVTPRGAQPRGASTEDGFAQVYVFTTTKRMTAFLAARTWQSFEYELVSSPRSVGLLIADLHSRGVTTFHIDPKPDGSGGRQLPLASLWSDNSFPFQQ